MTELADISGVGLAALAMVLGYYLIVSLKSVLTKHLERQELLLQKILIEMMAHTEKLSAIKDSFRIKNGSG